MAWLRLALPAAVLALPLLASSSYQRNLLDLAAIMCILSMSYNLILGAAGQVGLSHNAFYAIGAYATAIGLTRWGLPQLPAILLSLVACALAALIVGVPTLRLRGPYLAVATLALSVVTGVVLIQWRPVTGGVDGIGGIGRLRLLGWELGNVAYSYVTVIVALGVYWLLENLLHSPFGRATVAVRDHEGAAVALGVAAARQKITALVISAVLAGVAGNLYLFRERYVNPVTFGLELAFLLLFMAVIGGLGSTAGTALGAVIIVLLPEILSGMGTELYFLVYGVVTILVILYAPSGLVGLPRLLGRRLRLVAPGQPAAGQAAPPVTPGIAAQPADPAPPAAGGRGVGGDILRVEELTRRFGGIIAVNQATFAARRGSITALIGPNGAGKTTLFHLVSGALRPDAGRVYFEGEEITGLAPSLVARRGLIRTYQIVSLFPGMTVFDNVLTGYHRLHGADLLSSALRLPRFRAEEARARRRAEELLETFGLVPWRDMSASTLPFGLQRSAETARAMAASPRLLLLDEPAAGLNPEEAQGLKRILRSLRDRGVTILLIEHNLPLVIDLSDWVVVLNFGEVIAQGTPTEIQADPRVIEAYIGTPGQKDDRVAAGG